jgi:hypothetical protein
MVAIMIGFVGTSEKENVKSLIVSEVAFAKDSDTFVVVQAVEVLLLPLHYHSVNVGCLRRIEGVEVFV